MRDILFDKTDQDLSIVNGDWAIVDDSSSQEVGDLLLSYPGWWKQFPLVGVGAPSYLKGAGNGQALARNVQLQLSGDGKQMQNFSFGLVNGVLTISVNGISIQ